MNLGLFFYLTEIEQDTFAKKIGITRTYVNMIANSKARPSKRIALLIEENTMGIVSAKELREIPYINKRLKETTQ